MSSMGLAVAAVAVAAASWSVSTSAPTEPTPPSATVRASTHPHPVSGMTPAFPRWEPRGCRLLPTNIPDPGVAVRCAASWLRRTRALERDPLR